MSERTKSPKGIPPNSSGDERPLTPGELAKMMSATVRMAGRSLRQVENRGSYRATLAEKASAGLASPQQEALPPPKIYESYLKPEVARWRYLRDKKTLRGPRGFLAECLEPSNFPAGDIALSKELTPLIYLPEAPNPQQAFEALALRTRTLLERELGETLTFIVPHGHRGKEESFCFRETLAAQQERALGSVLYVRTDRQHPQWNFRAPNGETTVGRQAKLLTGLTNRGLMGRDELIRYLWDLEAGADVGRYKGALQTLIWKTNGSFSEPQAASREVKRGPQGFKMPFEYYIGSKARK